MARVLVVGCGCRGRALARDLIAEGHAARGTTRRAEGLAAIEEAGAEAHQGDPYRLGTVLTALDGVTIVCWLLASATGDPEELAELHGPRLERLLEEVVDTPVRGVVYEARGSVDPALLAQGREAVRVAHERWRIPTALVEADPGEPDAWRAAARAAVLELLAV